MLLCSYCIRPAALLKLGDAGYPYSRDYGPTWVCVPCRAWVGCHPGTEKPLGRVADAALRLAKMAAHQAFDRLWRKKMAREGISKSKARRAGYTWLSEQLGIPFEQTHIGYFDVAQCERVVDICTNPTTRSTTMPKQPLPTPAAFCDKPYVHIPLTPVVSNQVAAIGYCPDRKVLACTFTRGPGHVYHYPNVEPEFHAAFMAAESKGKFFGANVKPLPFDKFSSETMDEAIKAASDMSEPAQA